MEMWSELVGPNISPHYISISFSPLHFKCNYICHNRSGFAAWYLAHEGEISGDYCEFNVQVLR